MYLKNHKTHGNVTSSQNNLIYIEKQTFKINYIRLKIKIKIQNDLKGVQMELKLPYGLMEERKELNNVYNKQNNWITNVKKTNNIIKGTRSEGFSGRQCYKTLKSQITVHERLLINCIIYLI